MTVWYHLVHNKLAIKRGPILNIQGTLIWVPDYKSMRVLGYIYIGRL